MVRLHGKKFSNLSKEEENDDFFIFDSEETRALKRQKPLERVKSFFTSYPWWFYYISYITTFVLCILALLFYALYAPASVNLSVTDRFFARLPVQNYIYPNSFQNLNNITRLEKWNEFINFETDALDPKFLRISKFGPLPQPYNNIPVWEKYRSTYNQRLNPNLKKIVIIISNLGKYADATEIIVDLPPEVTLEFSPYSDYIGQWLLFARAEGHEVMLSVPLANVPHRINYNAGPLGIDFAFEPAQNLESLQKIMSAVTGYAGLSFSAVPNDENYNLADMKRLFELAGQHSLYVLGHKNYRNTLRTIPRMTYATIDKQIFDYNIKSKYMDNLDTVIEEFNYSNRNILVLRIDAFPFSAPHIASWINQLKKFQIIPLSYLFSQPKN